MKINYDKKMWEIIDKEKKLKRLLLHSCCAPCSSACLEKLTPYFDITILYYNPNIEPYEEYLKRKAQSNCESFTAVSTNGVDSEDLIT